MLNLNFYEEIKKYMNPTEVEDIKDLKSPIISLSMIEKDKKSKAYKGFVGTSLSCYYFNEYYHEGTENEKLEVREWFDDRVIPFIVKAREPSYYTIVSDNFYKDIDLGFIFFIDRYYLRECWFNWLIYDEYMNEEYMPKILNIVCHYLYALGYKELFTCVKNKDKFDNLFEKCGYIYETSKTIDSDKNKDYIYSLSIEDYLGIK